MPKSRPTGPHLASTMVSQRAVFAAEGCPVLALVNLDGEGFKDRSARRGVWDFRWGERGVDEPYRFLASGAESEIVALVLVIFHRLMEDVIGRQRAQRFGDFL
jgi:hypothetical protein